jgi:hypothetical protein
MGISAQTLDCPPRVSGLGNVWSRGRLVGHVNDEHRDGAGLEDVVADAAKQQGAKLTAPA